MGLDTPNWELLREKIREADRAVKAGPESGQLPALESQLDGLTYEIGSVAQGAAELAPDAIDGLYSDAETLEKSLTDWAETTSEEKIDFMYTLAARLTSAASLLDDRRSGMDEERDTAD